MIPSFRAPVAEPFPGEFVITRGFGDLSFPQYGPHDGLDIDNGGPAGDPIYAIADGQVSKALFDLNAGGAGIVRIEHGNGWSSGYAHLDRIDVHWLQNVVKGQVIGTLGSTGWVTGPHLHFDISLNGIRQDPLPLLQRGDQMALDKDKVGGLYGRTVIVGPSGANVRREPRINAERIIVLPHGFPLTASAVVTGGFVDPGGNQWYAVWVEENDKTLLAYVHDSTVSENRNAALDAARSEGYELARVDALEAIRKL